MKPLSLAFAALGIAVLAGLFLWMRPQPVAAPPTAPAVAATAVPGPSAAVAVIEPRQVEYRVEQGKLVAGPDTIPLREGEQLLLRILSDRDDEVHLHGYDLHEHLKAGVPAELKLTADHSGRFELELHHSDVLLGALEVQPK